MKKIPTLFKRVYEGKRPVAISPSVTPGFEWVLEGLGTATIKYDGSACAIVNGVFCKRYDAKAGKPVPEGAIKCQEEADPVTGHLPCWLPCSKDRPEDKWFWIALDNAINWPLPHHLRIRINDDGAIANGTFEAVGPHFGTNPHLLSEDNLIPHGDTAVIVERSFNGIKSYLAEHMIEGLVFWKDGEPQCKIKRSDFGLLWANKR